MLKVYGLKNCDTCRKARKWLEGENASYTCVDVRADGISKSDVTRWSKAAGWESLLNKSSTTWRGLEEGQKEGLTETTAIKLLTDNPTLIKRPVFENGKTIVVGLKPAQAAEDLIS